MTTTPLPNLRTIDGARSAVVSNVAQQLRAEAMAQRSGWSPHTPYPKQAAFLDLLCREALYGGAAGGGKLLDIATWIATPAGFRELGKLAPGDLVYGRDGQAHVILAESAVVTAPAYRLTFDDGAEIVAHDAHRWLTYDAADLAALSRRTDAFRTRRRARRPSRAAGHKSPAFTAAITARNQAAPPPTQAVPTGAVRSTADLVATLRTADGRANHAIPVTEPLDLPEQPVPLDPYVLGVWLGDGTSTTGAITTADPEITAAVVAAGFPIRRIDHKATTHAVTVAHDGLYASLKVLGVLGNKHVPHAYLWAARAQRLALLQGLMDTDGGIGDGSAEFTNTRQCLAEAVAHLARSLGHKVAVRRGTAKLDGRIIGSKWTVKFRAHLPVFRLRRKAERLTLSTRRTTRFRYLVSAERLDAVMMKCIRVSSPDHLYLAGLDLIPTHNSDALLMAALQYVHVPSYAALLLRRTYADLALPGAIMDRAEQWLRPTPAKWNGTDKTWTFPSGATLTFGYLETDADRFRYQGAELQSIGFDELTQFSDVQYRYLFSRLRRLAGVDVPLRMRSATNPGGSGHAWVHQRFIVEGPAAGRVFIPATIDDNPSLDREEYLASLSELDDVTRAQLELGSWDATEAGNKFKREWWTDYPARIVADPPANLDRVRYWDLASTEPRLRRGRMTDPDWTVGALLGRHAGVYYVLDLVRFRGTPLEVQARIKATAQADRRHVPIYIEQEPGSNAEIAMDHYRRTVLDGYDFHAVRSTGTKELRANPLSAAAEAGNVRLVRAPWLTTLLDELCAFPNGTHDDQVDAVSGAYTQLAARARRSAFSSAVGPPRPPLPRFIRD